VGESGVGIFDRFILADQAAQRRANCHGAGFQCRVGQAFIGFDCEQVNGRREQQESDENGFGEP
jgi:hypothetical protein